jgi:uncharacterized SAM-binding protein YcdF (DUF218 family)
MRPVNPTEDPATRMLKRPAKTELTWTKAVVVGLGVTILLLISLAWIPSYFTYWWSSRDAAAVKTIQSVVHHIPGFKTHTIQPYTSTRVRDAISLGFQSTVFAGIIVAAYVYGEKRRRRLGQRGADDVKGYLPGK